MAMIIGASLCRSTLLIIALAACAPRDDKSRPAVVDTPSNDADSLVHPHAIPSDVRVACDSAAAFVREALGLKVNREQGGYTDVSWGKPRTGCRLRAAGSLKAVLGPAGPTDMLDSAFVHRGWKPDFHFGADGAGGSTIGMRKADVLCFVTGRWIGGEETDTVRAPRPDDEGYWIIVECGLGVARKDSSRVSEEAGTIGAVTR